MKFIEFKKQENLNRMVWYMFDKIISIGNRLIFQNLYKKVIWIKIKVEVVKKYSFNKLLKICFNTLGKSLA